MRISKRDGRVVEFDGKKIYNAVMKAFIDVDGEETSYSTGKAKEISEYIESIGFDNLGVEDIQDIVENKLMASNRKDVAKAYILYRNERNKARERNSKATKELAETLAAKNVLNQNANVDEKSFGGRIGSASSSILKKYALDHCMSDMARNNHLNNEIYIHDLDHYAVGDHNCLSVPFDKLLANGFNTRQTDVRPAQSINTAFQLVAVIFQLQSLQQFGGVSATHLDWTMVPYVRKSFYKHLVDGYKYIARKDAAWIQQNVYDYINDPNCFGDQLGIDSDLWKDESEVYGYAFDMTEKETRQAVEAMYHNLKVLGRLNSNIKNLAI